MIIKSNNDQLTCLEKMFPKSGINNRERGYNTLLVSVKFMTFDDLIIKHKKYFVDAT